MEESSRNWAKVGLHVTREHVDLRLLADNCTHETNLCWQLFQKVFWLINYLETELIMHACPLVYIETMFKKIIQMEKFIANRMFQLCKWSRTGTFRLCDDATSQTASHVLMYVQVHVSRLSQRTRACIIHVEFDEAFMLSLWQSYGRLQAISEPSKPIVKLVGLRHWSNAVVWSILQFQHSHRCCGSSVEHVFECAICAVCEPNKVSHTVLVRNSTQFALCYAYRCCIAY